jgi:hypothetical protein
LQFATALKQCAAQVKNPNIGTILATLLYLADIAFGPVALGGTPEGKIRTKPDPALRESAPEDPSQRLIEEATRTRSRFATFKRAAFENGGKDLRVWIQFNNAEFRRFWSNEVAVQYIFDAALNAILSAIFDSGDARFKPLETVNFIVDIRPHDVPPVLEWEISRKAWNAGKEQQKKVTLYKTMKLTSNGRKFEFDPVIAADIE